MIYNKSIVICGGDSRQKFMYECMKEKGLKVSSFALFYNDLNDVEDIKKFDVVILPVPVTRDGVYLNSEHRVKLDDIFSVLSETQIVLGGMYDGIIDYCKSEKFQMQNAIPTAEGALQIAMENTDITINKSKCAVFGFGRIGKVISSMLKSMGAEVTVYARNPKDLAFADISGYKTENINNVDALLEFDIIFNTVPKIILDRNTLTTTKNDVLIIELASKPYGTDTSAAEELGKKVIVASGLPGKVASKTAGKILFNVITDILLEMEV